MKNTPEKGAISIFPQIYAATCCFTRVLKLNQYFSLYLYLSEEHVTSLKSCVKPHQLLIFVTVGFVSFDWRTPFLMANWRASAAHLVHRRGFSGRFLRRHIEISHRLSEAVRGGGVNMLHHLHHLHRGWL